MKGIVFTELIEMVENDLGIEIADRMISGAQTKTDGAYTSVGTYDHTELIQLVVVLSRETNVPVPELVRAFGKHVFGRFVELYPQFFAGVESSLDFLPSVETYIHGEVRKLYPDAELPSFDCEKTDDGLQMTYRSSRPFADLAEGMILAAVDHFADDLQVERTDLGAADGTQARFTLSPAVVASSTEASVACPT